MAYGWEILKLLGDIFMYYSIESFINLDQDVENLLCFWKDATKSKYLARKMSIVWSGVSERFVRKCWPEVNLLSK